MAIDDDMQTFTHKVRTNGDRIRQMTDVRLVMFLGTDCNRCARSENCELRGDPVNYGICVKGNIEWLKQGVGEDDGSKTNRRECASCKNL